MVDTGQGWYTFVGEKCDTVVRAPAPIREHFLDRSQRAGRWMTPSGQRARMGPCCELTPLDSRNPLFPHPHERRQQLEVSLKDGSAFYTPDRIYQSSIRSSLSSAQLNTRLLCGACRVAQRGAHLGVLARTSSGGIARPSFSHAHRVDRSRYRQV